MNKLAQASSAPLPLLSRPPAAATGGQAGRVQRISLSPEFGTQNFIPPVAVLPTADPEDGGEGESTLTRWWDGATGLQFGSESRLFGPGWVGVWRSRRTWHSLFVCALRGSSRQRCPGLGKLEEAVQKACARDEGCGGGGGSAPKMESGAQMAGSGAFPGRGGAGRGA